MRRLQKFWPFHYKNIALKEKDWFRRNESLWTFIASIGSIAALIVSILVMLDSKDVSNKNFELSIRQYELQKLQTIKDSISKAENDFKDSIYNERNFIKQDSINTLQMRFYQRQIELSTKQLQSSSQQFENENSAFLEFSIDSLKKRHWFYLMNYHYKNLGKATVQILSEAIKIEVFAGYLPHNIKEFSGKPLYSIDYDYKTLNYLVNDVFFKRSIFINPPDSAFQYVLGKQLYLRVTGYINYRNLVALKKFKNRFLINITYDANNETMSSSTVRNETKPIP